MDHTTSEQRISPAATCCEYHIWNMILNYWRFCPEKKGTWNWKPYTTRYTRDAEAVNFSALPLLKCSCLLVAIPPTKLEAADRFRSPAPVYHTYWNTEILRGKEINTVCLANSYGFWRVLGSPNIFIHKFCPCRQLITSCSEAMHGHWPAVPFPWVVISRWWH